MNQELVKSAIELLGKNKDISSINKIKFESYEEGLSVQILHIGSYDDEKEKIEKMKEFIKNNSLIENGLHHEIISQTLEKLLQKRIRRF